MRRQDAVERYYGEVLPRQLEAHRPQWQLWYLTNALLL
jgi:hypothetical protein